MHVLIAGFGRLGGFAARLLLDRGHEVTALRRHTARVPAGLRSFAADLGDAASLEGLPAVDRVLYCAAPGAMSEEDYRSVYLRGAVNLLRALSANGSNVARFLFISSTAVYGVDDGSPVDEESRCEPPNFRGRVLLEAEHTVAEGAAGGVSLRLGGLYGPGPGRLVASVRQGDPCSPGRFTNRIHVGDAAGAAVHLLLMGDPRPVYLGVDDLPAPDCEVRDWLADRLGLGAVPRGEPAGGGKRCSNARLRRSGYALRYPDYRRGYGEILDGRSDD